MSRPFLALTVCNLRVIFRDRVLHGVLGVAVVILVLVPALSSFSMRQMQEVAITLSLSAASLMLLVLTLLLGSLSVWRDVERKYTASVLSLPVSRASYLLSKYCAIVLFLLVCGAILIPVAVVVIQFASAQYPSDLPVAWGTIVFAVFADVVKFSILSGFALLLSTVSTSFFLPFFGTLAIYLAGSASQEVYEYAIAQFGNDISTLSLVLIKATYYLLPNFAAFNYKVHAVYALPVSIAAFLLSFIYTLTYVGLLLGLSVWSFNRKELP